MISKQVIINADDYGLTPEVSRGIRYCYINGILTSTSIIANGLSTEEDIPKLLSECRGIGIGAHLTLTTFRPVSDPKKISTLVNSQKLLWNHKQLLQQADSIDLQQLYDEWTLQLQKLFKMKVPLDHLNGHHDVIFINSATKQVATEIAKKFDLPIRPSADPSEDIKNPLSQGIASTDRVITDFMSAGGSQQSLRDSFYKISRGSCEIISHAGFIDKQLRAISSMVEQRLTELNTLCSHESLQLPGIYDVELCTYRDLWR